MRFSRLWIRAISLLVPGDERREWMEEWDAELKATGHGTAHALGALPDAWYLRMEGWTMEGMLRDLRMAVKTLWRKPFFTALAGVTLAVGIGANTAIFSVVDGVLLNPLPFPDSHEILSVNYTAPGLNVPLVPHSEGTYLFNLERFRNLESFAVFSEGTANLITDGDPQRLRAALVTEPFFDVMGVHPFLGRAFLEGEDRPGGEAVAILSYALWQQTFGGDREVVGRTVEMNGVQRQVVGIMPEGFDFPQEVELWLPRVMDPVDPAIGSMSLVGLGRLAPGSSMESVAAEMQENLFLIADAYPEELSREVLEQAEMRPDPKPLKELFVEDMRQALWVLMGTVGFVLLIACANVANLFLVRAEARQREHALKKALGASRGDLMRQYLSESLTLALGGGLLGLLLAGLGVKALLAIAPVTLPRILEIGVDGTVLLFTVGISLASGLFFGLFPVFAYSGKELSGSLKEGGRSSTTGRERHRARNILVVAQVALALILLVGSGLMARSFMALRTVDPGFDSSSRLTFRVALPEAEWQDSEGVSQFHQDLQGRMAAIPGVQAASLITAVPLEDHKTASPMEAQESPLEPGELGPIVDRRFVSPGYFSSMGIELMEGREFDWTDGTGTARGIVVSETLARTFWPDEPSVLGKLLRGQGDENSWLEVVGVARDVRFETLTTPPAPLVYLPLAAEEEDPVRSLAVVLHTGSDPLGFVAQAREALRAVAPRIPLVDPRTVASIEADAMAATSFTVILLGIASGIALLLGTVGIYGVISYVVSRRTQEIGVRIALGAPAGAVLKGVLGQGMVLTGIGIGLGLVGAWGVSRVLSSLLFGVSATDPLTYLGMALLLACVACAASWIPGRRAARIDPVEALRSE